MLLHVKHRQPSANGQGTPSKELCIHELDISPELGLILHVMQHVVKCSERRHIGKAALEPIWKSSQITDFHKLGIRRSTLPRHGFDRPPIITRNTFANAERKNLHRDTTHLPAITPQHPSNNYQNHRISSRYYPLSSILTFSRP